ncbi:CHAPERONE-ACTIVITY OF BC1 COMPLEX CABC1 -RELATED [Salix viminalis]|uniref:CHAPERONE-ACTIVITY OF BC1 COMPLEX CABC1 -RELATED n=1 Tax=Salix viminalis TaxID=40686 RepID=A0A9Q0V886_SALVM|nr:CHAPERONE-ACTIVITY OF BC1 COMPLEX CABC1 -RELATED [Salix viminalis]
MDLIYYPNYTITPSLSSQNPKTRSRILLQRSNFRSYPIRAAAASSYVETTKNGASSTTIRRNVTVKTNDRDSSSAMDQLDIERGVCVPFRKYSPETVRSKVLESRGAISSLMLRGVEIVWSLGLYWSNLVYDFLVGRDEEVVPYRARQLRNLLCDLGPSFIKAGQVLANRPDIIREDYMNELCVLQDDVPPFPNQVAFNIIEEELGQPLEDVFSNISPQTIAAASLGQVYRATLRATGEDVAIKVQRPQIEPIIFRDLFLFRTLASFLNGISLQKLGCNAELIVDEFGEKLLEELDYTLEARNIEDFLENFKDDPTVKIPRVYRKLCGSRVLVMEWIDGIRCTNPQAIRDAGIDVNGFLTVGVSAALRQLLEFGLFHGDPHPGNIFAMRDGRIAYVDFGNVAVLSQQNKQILIDAVVHAVNEDYAEMANDFTRLGFLSSDTDVAPIIPALEAIWQNSVGKGLSDFNFITVTGKFNQLVYNYPIRIPERFSLVIRSLLTQEGICLMLEPDFKFLEVAYPYIAKRLLTDPNPALRERLIQVLFKGGVFQWKRLENLIVLAKENVAKMSSNPALQVKDIQNSRSLQVKKKLDLTNTIKDGARLFFTDEGIRRQLLLAMTEDSKLHIEELVDVYRLVEDQIDIPSVTREVVRDIPTVIRDLMLSWSDSILSGRRLLLDSFRIETLPERRALIGNVILISVLELNSSQSNDQRESEREKERRKEASSALWLLATAISYRINMPRKGNYGVDYDDYDDYDYDYDYDVEDQVEAPEPKKETSSDKVRVWGCSICTYDNDESMTACDICGVMRSSVLGKFKDDKETAGIICKDSGVSIMAKSLFASLPHRTPRKAVVGQRWNDDFVTEEGDNFHKLGNFQGKFDEFHKALSPHNCSHFDIAPFKFDFPSPDDMVSNGIRSSKIGSKANLINSRSQKASAGLSETVKSSDKSSAPMPKGKQGRPGVNDGNPKKNGVADTQSSDETSDSTSSSMPKGKDKSVGNASTSINGGKSLGPTSNLNDLSLSDKSGNLNKASARRSKPSAQYQPNDWMLPDKSENALTQLNLAIVGHVDSGKSTLSGRLLHLSGRITQKEMHKYEKEAKLQGKGSFAYAWALDESPEERERGITMTVAVAYFDSKKYHVVVLDSPGHKDFVPNMISGATQADAAILVIDASIGGFEAGMDSKGQTKEHARLIRSFGVDQIIVAVNKMDSVQYSKDRFDLIGTQLGTFLRSCGFKDSLVSWIPLSAVENQNLVAAPSDVCLSSWYQGSCLLDAIDSLQPPKRDFSKPLLMPICDVVKSSSQGPVSACGKLEAGALRSGLKVLVMPSGDVGTIRSLERDSQICAVARAGDNVTVSLQGIDGSNVMAGGVLCHPDFPVAVAKHFELKVLVLDFLTIPIVIGSQLEFHIHHAKEAARVVKIISVLDPKTGKVSKKAPRCLTSKQSAIIEVALDGTVCAEEFTNSRALGRAFLRTLGKTVAVGIVTRIIEDQE